MLTSTQLRVAWSPRCTGPWARVALNGSGVVSVRPAIVDAVKALNKILVKYNYRTRSGDTGAYNCRRIAGTSRYSLHAYGIALDINWTTNPYQRTLKTDMPRAMVSEIKALRTGNGRQVWGWGGDYSGSKDAMHYEIVCRPSDISTGIRGGVTSPVIIVPPVIQPPTPSPGTLEEEETMFIIKHPSGAMSRITGDYYWDYDGSDGENRAAMYDAKHTTPDGQPPDVRNVSDDEWNWLHQTRANWREELSRIRNR